MPDDPLLPIHPPAPPKPSTPITTGPPFPDAPTTTGLTPNVAAGIAVLFTFVSGIIFLVIEKRSLYVRFWAMQATIYGLIWVVARLALGILAVLFSFSVTLLALLYHVWQLCNLVFFIGLVIMLYYAFTGKEWELPFVGKVARQQLAKFLPPQG